MLRSLKQNLPYDTAIALSWTISTKCPTPLIVFSAMFVASLFTILGNGNNLNILQPIMGNENVVELHSGILFNCNEK